MSTLSVGHSSQYAEGPSENQATPRLTYRAHVPALDGLRGIAILAFFFYHYARGAGEHTSSTVVRAASTAFGFGWTGVDLFFVLSGFLITGILYDTLGDPGYFKKFYVRRMLRIFPIYYLMIAIFLALTPVLKFHWRPAHLFFLVYLGYPAALVWPYLIGVSSMVAITHLWSLSVEEQFYIVWPWIISKLRSPTRILRACVVIATSALVLRAVICASSPLGVTWAYAFLLCRMDTIATGAAIAILVRGPLRENLQRWAPFIAISAAIAIIAICIVRRSVDHDDLVVATIGFSIIAVMYGALLVLALREGTWLAGLLSLSILRMFGKYSYGLYLYHFPLTVVLGPLKQHFVTWMHSYVIGATVHLGFNLVVNFLIAVASFHLIESPIMRLKERFRYT
jgi:peptidoglycan/LPS O-acetylase OafA/YrhL